MKSPCVAIVLTLLALLGRTSYANCGTYENCLACTSAEGCMWALLYNCTEVCINQNYKDPEIRSRDVIWRSAVSNSTQCSTKEWCEIVEGGVPNPSFEDYAWVEYGPDEIAETGVNGKTTHDPWIFARTIPVKNSSMIVVPDEERLFYWALDGDFFFFMGRSTAYKITTFEVRLDNTLEISNDATHLSFFYALPYYSNAFVKQTSNTFTPFIDRTALDVYIDGDHVLRMSNQNINETFYRESAAFYHPMNIDVSRYADGKKHSLVFYFTRPTDPNSQSETLGTQEQLMLIDYVQIIKSNLNGSTFDGWKGAPFDKESSCSLYCLEEYIKDGTCDMVCMTKGCKKDGGDCDYEKISTQKILIVVFSVICVVAVISIVILLAYMRLKTGGGRGINGYKLVNSDVEMGNKKHHKKGWSVSTKNIMFGGKEASIGIALKDTLTVTNTGKPRTFSVGLFDEARCNSDMKFKITINPKEFYLEKNEEQLVNIFVKIFCTTTISERIEVTSNEEPEDSEIINLVARGKKSTRINPYDLAIGDIVGEGSFGVVYRGVYKKTFNVAVKRLKAVEEDAIESFNKEADILEKVHSDYTVKFYGALVTDEYYCFVTEFIQFGSLSSLLPRIIPGDPNGGKRMLIALNIAKALKYLHENNILYRDLKPDNVLVSSNIVRPDIKCVVCKLTDFGTSKVLQSKENMTKMLGTPSYMAPEVMNDNSYGKESDIYSLGASFIELWSGKQPLEDLELKFYTFIRRIASGELKLVFAPGPSEAPCPREVEELINRCLNRDPVIRPPIDEIISVLTKAWMALCPGIKDFNLFH